MVSILGSYIIHSSKKNTGRINSDPTTRRPPPGRTSDRAGGSKRGRRASRPQSRVYGVRAVVVVDIRSNPERVCTLRPTRGRVVESRKKARGSRLVVILERRERRPSPGPNGEISMPVTVHRRGGGTGGPSDVRRGVGAVRPNPLGAGKNHCEITPNCIDVDGRCGGVRTTTR